MIEKINTANNLMTAMKIKAIKLETINIDNLIFSLNNVDKHYVTTNKLTTWYCANVYRHGLPKNESEIKEYCSRTNLFRSLHDNDYERRVRLVCGTEESIDKLLNYLTDNNTERGKNERIKSTNIKMG